MNIIEYTNFKMISLQEIENFILSSLHGFLKDLKVMDLIYFNDSINLSGNGVYIFYNCKAKEFVYVGKCSSRHFVERIPMHFDPRLGGWFNSLLKTMLKDYNDKDDNSKQLRINEILQLLFYSEDYQLLLIECKGLGSKSISRLETLLRDTQILNPKNRAKRKIKDLNKKVYELVE